MERGVEVLEEVLVGGADDQGCGAVVVVEDVVEERDCGVQAQRCWLLRRCFSRCHGRGWVER